MKQSETPPHGTEAVATKDNQPNQNKIRRTKLEQCVRIHATRFSHFPAIIFMYTSLIFLAQFVSHNDFQQPIVAALQLIACPASTNVMSYSVLSSVTETSSLNNRACTQLIKRAEAIYSVINALISTMSYPLFLSHLVPNTRGCRFPLHATMSGHQSLRPRPPPGLRDNVDRF